MEDVYYYIACVFILLGPILFLYKFFLNPYIKTRKYPKKIELKDIEFIEKGREIKIKTVSKQTMVMDFEKYKKEYEKSKIKGYIDVDGLFVNIDNIESTSLRAYGVVKYKDFNLLYNIYCNKIIIYKRLKGVKIYYNLIDNTFYKNTIPL